MANGNTLEEIKRLVEDDNISSKAARRLTLSMQIEMYEMLQKLDGRVVKVEQESIGGWIRRNSRTAILLFILYHIVAASFYVSGWRKPILQALGVPPDLVP